MDLALTLLAIAATVTLVAAVADWRGWPAPLLLIVTGMLGSYLPFVPDQALRPQVVLVGVLPPLLYAAAIQTSLVDFRKNKGPIAALSVGLVIFTATGVGLVAWWLLPIPFAVAFALGAIVAPPDAVAATAIARRIGLPRRLVTILEGESLLNDATALVSLRTALAAAGLAAAVTGTRVSAASVSLDFAVAVAGGVAVGFATAAVIGFARKHARETVTDTALSFMTPYLAYLPAEAVHGSGVLAVVVAGLILGHRSPVLQDASSRLSERINWASIQFLLENAVFLMMGLQVFRVVAAARSSDLGLGRIVLATTGVLVGVLVLRPAWVFPYRWISTHLLRREAPSPTAQIAVLSWAGMRGVVTVAAAFTLPAGTPHRDVLVLIAMVVAVGTLLIQGTTLSTLARALGVRGPDPREDALQEASIMQAAVSAGLAELTRHTDEDPRTVEMIRQRAEDRTNRTWERLGPRGEGERETPSEAYRRLRMLMLTAERTELLRIRDAGVADQQVLRGVMAQLDIEESMLDRSEEREEQLHETVLQPGTAGPCEHLRAAGVSVVPVTRDRVCPDCLREGLTWVHLRLCLTCGHVGCCDSSQGRHAEGHFRECAHPVMRSFEPGEAWRWCYVDDLVG